MAPRLSPCRVFPVVAAAALLWGSGAPSAQHGPLPVRVVFTAGMLLGVNHDDAKASIQVWATAVVKNSGLDLKVSADIVDSVDTLRRRLAEGTADLYGVRIDELLELERAVGTSTPLGVMHVGLRNGVATERYVLITHRASGLTSLASLKGRTLLTVEGPRRGLAPMWLDTTLLEAGLPVASEFFAHVTSAEKPAKAILPVFFRQKDVALATEASLATVAEMNPQVGHDLVVVARSEPIVPVVTIVRQGFAPERVEAAILKAVTSAGDQTAGQQILSFFGTERVVRAGADDLASARALAEKYRRMVAKAATRRAP